MKQHIRLILLLVVVLATPALAQNPISSPTFIQQPGAYLVTNDISHGGIVIEINPERTPLTRWVDYVFAEKAGEFLPKLVGAILQS
ncbi:MAG: hypothetical protein AAGD38_23230 [Acidobacteriota bacterium]